MSVSRFHGCSVQPKPITSRPPFEALISFAVDRGQVSFLPYEWRITVIDVEIRPHETGYIDLDGVAALAKPKQNIIHLNRKRHLAQMALLRSSIHSPKV